MHRRVASPAFGLAILALCCCSLAIPITAVGNGSLIAAGNGTCTTCQAFNWTQPGRVVLDDIAARRQVCLQSPLAPSKLCTQAPLVQPTCNGLPCDATTGGVPPICYNSTGQGFCNVTTNSTSINSTSTNGTSTNGTSSNGTASAAATASPGRHLLQSGTEIGYVNPSGAVDGSYYVQAGFQLSTLGNLAGTNFAMYDKCEQGVFVTSITFFTEDWTGALIGMLWYYSDDTWVASPGIDLAYQLSCTEGPPYLESPNDPAGDECRYTTVQTGILGGNIITGLTMVMGGANNVYYGRYTALSSTGYINFPISSVTITFNSGLVQSFGYTPTNERDPGPSYSYPATSLGSGILCGFIGLVSPYQDIQATPPGGVQPSILNQNNALLPGQSLVAQGGACWVTYQEDSNLVVYNYHGAVWASNTQHGGNGQAGQLYMRNDGNLCILDSSGYTYWCLGTDNYPGHAQNYYLAIESDCSLMIYSNSGNPDVGAVWSSGSGRESQNMPPFGFLLQLQWVFLQTIESASMVDVTFTPPSANLYANANPPQYNLGAAITIPEGQTGTCGASTATSWTTTTTLTSELATTISATASLEIALEIKVPLIETTTVKGGFSSTWSQAKSTTTSTATSEEVTITFSNSNTLNAGTWKCVYVFYNSVLTCPYTATLQVVLASGASLAFATSGTYNGTSKGMDPVSVYGELLLCPSALYGAGSDYCIPQDIAYPSTWDPAPQAKDRRRLLAAHHSPPCPKSSPPTHRSPPAHHASPPPPPGTPTLLDICYTAYVPSLLASLTDVANITGTSLARLAQINPFVQNVTRPLGNTQVLLDSCHNGTVA